MAKDRKIVKYRKRKYTYAGVIFFASIFIYLILVLIFYFTKERVTIYEVVKGTVTVNEENKYTGFILRDEIVLSADKSGYINFYACDCDRIAVNSSLYSIGQEENQFVSIDQLNTSGNILDPEHILTIRNNIEQFSTNFSNSNFDFVYSFKHNLENIVLEDFNESQLSSMGETFKVNRSDYAGTLSYYTDGYEDMNQNEINNKIFNNEAYVRKIIRPGDLVEKGEVLFKIIPTETWSIYTPLNKDEVDLYKDESRLKINITYDNITSFVDFEVLELDDGAYGKFTLDKYMVRYINNRYLEFSIVKNKELGLKIPSSALVEKEFFIIPEEYCFYGKNINDITTKNFLIEYYDEENKLITKTITPKIYYKDSEGFYYISKDDVKQGYKVKKTDSLDEFIVSQSRKINGVYNVNNGYASFLFVDIKAKIDDYYIIAEGNFYSLKQYDYIVLNSSKVLENEFVFR